jgi:hypothetical protein
MDYQLIDAVNSSSIFRVYYISNVKRFENIFLLFLLYLILILIKEYVKKTT